MKNILKPESFLGEMFTKVPPPLKWPPLISYMPLYGGHTVSARRNSLDSHPYEFLKAAKRFYEQQPLESFRLLGA